MAHAHQAERASFVESVRWIVCRDYFLDLLDMILLACIFTTAVGSLAFLSGGSSWVLVWWQVAIYLGAAMSVSAFVMAAFHEIHGKAYRAKVKAMYMSPGGLGRVASWLQSAVLPPVPEELTPATTGKLKLKAAIMKVGSRGNMLFGSMLNSLHTHAVKYGFAPEVRGTMSDRLAPSLCLRGLSLLQRINREILDMVNNVTCSAQLYLDHCNGNSYLSKKPEAVFFRRLVQAFPEVPSITVG